MNKIIEKMFAAVLIFSLLLTSIVLNASAEKSDVSNSENEIMLLRKLGFVNEAYGPKTGDEAVTRGQFVSMLAYLRGFDDTYTTSVRKFIDIPNDYWCAGQIYALYNDGIIKGVSDELFAPNNYITYPQAVKCLVCLLGYELQAEQQGGYPGGYIKVASQIGIGTETTDGGLDFNTVAKLMTKAMDTDMMEFDLSAGHKGVYAKAKDQTPLKKYNDIYYDTGVLTDNGISSLKGNTVTNKGTVVINGITLNEGDCDVEQYLGYKLKYYYKDDDDDLTLLFVIPYRTNTVEIIDEDLDIENTQFSTKRIYYTDEKRVKFYKVDDYADVIYNGKAYPAFDVNTLKINQGNLKLVDNDGDDDYDVVFVNEYYNVYTSGIDKSSEIVYGKYGNSIDYGSYNIVEFYANDGLATSVESVNENQVLSVFESKDHDYIKIVISIGGVTGKVESIKNNVIKKSGMTSSGIEKFKSDAKNMRVTIEDNEYELSSEYIDAVAKGYQGANIPIMGLTYAFHLDKEDYTLQEREINVPITGGMIINGFGRYGGAFYIDFSGELTLNDVSICGNIGDMQGGCIYNKGIVTMNGGLICGNRCDFFGGGVRCNQNSTFTINNGSIICNTSLSSRGGGVFCDKNCTFTMNDAIIGDNRASDYGGGVFADASATVIVGGATVVRENFTDIDDSNIHLQNNSTTVLKLSDTNPLCKGADVGITLWSSSGWNPGTAVDSYFGGTLTEDNCKYIVLNNSGNCNKGTVYSVKMNSTISNFVLAGDYSVSDAELPDGVKATDGVQSVINDDNTADMRFFWNINFNGNEAPSKLGVYFFDWEQFNPESPSDSYTKIENNEIDGTLTDSGIFFGTITGITDVNKTYYAIPIVNGTPFSQAMLSGTVNNSKINEE